LTIGQRSVLTKELELGRSHLLTSFTLKLAHWVEPPWPLCARAHLNAHVARDAHRQCLASNHPRRKAQALKVEPLLSEGHLFQSGVGLPDDRVQHVCAFVSELLWAPTADRAVEAQRRADNLRGHSDLITQRPL